MTHKNGHPKRFREVLGLFVVLLLPGLVRAESVLNFPRLANQPGTITGVAFVNPNDVEAPIRLTAYGTDGLLIQGQGITNPVDVTVPPNRQIGMLTSQLFGNGLPSNTVGWFQAVSPSNGVTGFFLYLNSGGTLFFDGADLPPLDRKIVFNQIRIDNGYTTELNLINTEDLPTRIDLYLFNGNEIREVNPDDIDFTLPGKGVARLNVGSMFGAGPLSEGAYLIVISDTNVGGFEFVRGPAGDLLGLNARSAADFLDTIYFPQLAVRGPWLMEIGIVNYSTDAVSLVLTAYQPDGRPFAAPEVTRNRVVRNLAGGLALRENVETLFGFTGGEALSGWIEVESTSRAVNGYVSYGVPAVGSVAAVAAVAQPVRRAIFSHIATTLGFFTGVAALNPSSLAANVRFVAISQGGQTLGHADRVLRPGERISQLITQLIPESAGQAGGVIWVSSDIPIHLTSLFGTNTGSVLANIPPQPAPDSYQPDAGIPRLSVDPSFAVLNQGGSLQFQGLGTNAGLTWFVEGGSNAPPDPGSIQPNGLYEAPESLNQGGSVTVSAEADSLVGAATVDLLAASVFLEGLDNPGALAYLPGARQLYAAAGSAAVAGDGVEPQGVAGTRPAIVELTAQGTSPVAMVAGDDIAGLLPFQAFDGSEFLLATGRNSGRLLRIDPATGGVRSVAEGLVQPGPIAGDPLGGSIWVAHATGLTRYSRALVESDLVSGLSANGAQPEVQLEISGVSGLAVDGCSGWVYYSITEAGEVREFRPEDGTSRILTEMVAAPGALLGLQRRDSGCEGSFQLVVFEESGGLRLLNAGPSPLPWSAADSVQGLVLLPAGNPMFGVETVAFTEAAAAPAGAPTARVTSVAVPALYQTDAVNPPVAPTGLWADPAGDTYNAFEGRVHDIVELTAESDGTNLNIQVSFADTISPCEQSSEALNEPCDGAVNAEDAVAGFVDLDVDQDPLTGLLSFADANSPYSSRMGAEFCVDFFRYSTGAGGVEVYESDGTGYVLLGRVPVTFTSHGLSFSIPLSALGDDGRVNLSAVFGTTFPGLANIGPTDAAPNGGFLRSSATSQGVTVSARTHRESGAVRLLPVPGSRGWTRVLGRD